VKPINVQPLSLTQLRYAKEAHKVGHILWIDLYHLVWYNNTFGCSLLGIRSQCAQYLHEQV
jgi:hypothetical protein